MAALKEFVHEIGQGYVWPKIEAYLVGKAQDNPDEPRMSIYSIKGFASRVSKENMKSILQNANLADILHAELQKHLEAEKNVNSLLDY